MINQTVSYLISELRSIPKDTNAVERSKRKVNIILEFAEKASKRILKEADFEYDDDEGDVFYANMMAHGIATDGVPDDCFEVSDTSLYLKKVSPFLNATDYDASFSESNKLHELVFGIDRVLDWDGKNYKIIRVMSYEEAARLVIFFFAENILNIMRENKWDRIEKLPDLYDRLASLL